MRSFAFIGSIYFGFERILKCDRKAYPKGNRTLSMQMQYTLDYATAKDIDILDRIHTENMKDYVETVYSWNPTLFRNNFVAKDYRVIKHQNEIIGFIKVVASKTSIDLGEIQITRNYQNRGIGTNIRRCCTNQSCEG